MLAHPALATAIMNGKRETQFHPKSSQKNGDRGKLLSVRRLCTHLQEEESCHCVGMGERAPVVVLHQSACLPARASMRVPDQTHVTDCHDLDYSSFLSPNFVLLAVSAIYARKTKSVPMNRSQRHVAAPLRGRQANQLMHK